MPCLKEDGDLCPLLRTCTASLIMHFCPMMKDFGSTNAVISKMITARKSAKIGNDPVKAFERWSKILLDGFQCRNVQN